MKKIRGRLIDELHTEFPTWGSRKIRDDLRNRGYKVNRKRIQRLMRLMGIEVFYPKRNLSKLGHAKYIRPYLLKGLKIGKPNQAWAVDITYIPKARILFPNLFSVVRNVHLTGYV